MIKINLLGSAPPPSRASSGGPPAPRATQALVFVGALIISFGIVGVMYEVWTNQIATLQKKRDQERLRTQELALVQAQNQKYQEHLRDLETRIDTIQALQNSRVGPVQLMSALGNVVNKTSDVFLYTLTPAPVGDGFLLKGQSSTVSSMANLLASLKNSGTFQEVQLDQFYQDDKDDRLTYKFSLSGQFKSPTGVASPTSGAAPEAPPGTAPAAVPGGTSGKPPLAGAAPGQAAPPQSQPQKRLE
ncbi:MAG: PilN domain-containing protein [Terriglobia bacterium]